MIEWVSVLLVCRIPYATTSLCMTCSFVRRRLMAKLLSGPSGLRSIDASPLIRCTRWAYKHTIHICNCFFLSWQHLHPYFDHHLLFNCYNLTVLIISPPTSHSIAFLRSSEFCYSCANAFVSPPSKTDCHLFVFQSDSRKQKRESMSVSHTCSITLVLLEPKNVAAPGELRALCCRRRWSVAELSNSGCICLLNISNVPTFIVGTVMRGKQYKNNLLTKCFHECEESKAISKSKKVI